MKRIQFSLRDIFFTVLYCMLLLFAAGAAWALRLARWDVPGAMVAASLIGAAIGVGSWIGTPAGQNPTVKRIVLSAVVTCFFVLTYAIIGLSLNR